MHVAIGAELLVELELIAKIGALLRGHPVEMRVRVMRALGAAGGEARIEPIQLAIDATGTAFLVPASIR